MVTLMTETDLDDVLELQSLAYHDKLLESKSTFATILKACPTGCFVLRNISGRMIAYIFTYPSNSQTLPPVLNSNEDLSCKINTDIYYLHDLAVHIDARNIGAGTRLLHCAIVAAQKNGFYRFALTAVQDSQKFWSRFGFFVVATEFLDGNAQRRLATYSNNAVVMMASYADIIYFFSSRLNAIGLDL